MLKIALRAIPSEGLDFHQSISAQDIGLTKEEANIQSLLEVKARIERVDHVVIARTCVKAQFGYCCARCLEDLCSVEEYRYTFDFDVPTGCEDIDLGEEIRQEIIMANPSKVLCRENCKGICPACGMNLNMGKCRCT